jgi:hypothetical protein
MTTVNENSWSKVVINPLDEDGQSRVPSSCRYRLDDKTTGNAIIAWTDVGTLSEEMEIEIPASSNAIIDTSLPEEVKVVTVETDYGTSDAHVEEHEYTVINLQFVS